MINGTISFVNTYVQLFIDYNKEDCHFYSRFYIYEFDKKDKGIHLEFRYCNYPFLIEDVYRKIETCHNEIKNYDEKDIFKVVVALFSESFNNTEL